MKLLSTQGRLALDRLTKKRTRKHLKRADWRAYLRGEDRKYHHINAPEIFAITANLSERGYVLQFLEKLRAACRTKRKIKLNFSKTAKMYTCGTLLFYSEIRNLHNSMDNVPCIRMEPSKNMKVMQVMKQIGLLSLLNFRNTIRTSYDDVVKWKFTTGNNVDGSEYENILKHLDAALDERIQKDLFKAFSEAMTNTHQHAYIDERPEGPVFKSNESWWSFSQVKDDILHVVFCDLGIGIPGSLPTAQPGWFLTIQKMFPDGQDDGKVIREALSISKTRTGLEHRGKGLGQLFAAIKDIDAGYFSILSRRGGYLFEGGKERTRTYKESIGGTLIEWKLPLDATWGAQGHAKDH